MSAEPGAVLTPATIAYLGPPGTFSEEALRAVLGARAGEVALLPMETNRGVVLAVQNDAADAALAPIENSVEGAVTETLDALVHDAPDTRIGGELVRPINHCLIAGSQLPLDRVTTVASHPQPLAQCAGFIRDHLPNARRMHAASTAEAVRDAIEQGDGHAAIGARVAADTYGGVVLAEAIEDAHDNQTRFVWLAKRPLADGWPSDAVPVARKTSVVFAGFNDTSPGALVGILSEFAYRSVNLSKIESRPERTQLGHYLFFVDLDGDIADKAVAEALAAIEGKVRVLRVLGSYPAFQL